MRRKRYELSKEDKKYLLKQAIIETLLHYGVTVVIVAVIFGVVYLGKCICDSGIHLGFKITIFVVFFLIISVVFEYVNKKAEAVKN